MGRSATSGSAGPSAAAALSRRHQALLLATGAATLALELLASRVLTPYFGVSLYIWAGILSITLIFLAVGYRVGGLLADLSEAELLEALALAAPLVAAIAIGVACALYPAIFPALAGPNLVVGSFVAAAVLLAAPLVTLAASGDRRIPVAGAGARAASSSSARSARSRGCSSRRSSSFRP